MKIRSASLVVASFALLICGGSRIAKAESIEISDCRVSAVERVSLAGERLGIIASIPIQEGDSIEAGDLVVQIQDAAAQTALATAEKESGNDIDLRFAKKLSELSTLEYSKARQLNQEIPNGQAEIEVLKLRLSAERALLQIEQAAHRLELAELRKREAQVAVESFRIRTPISGVVLQVHRRPGESIHAGDPVIEVANMDRMRVEGFLPVADAWKVKRGDPVTVSLAEKSLPKELLEKRFIGQVTFVDPQINDVSQHVRIWAEVSNAQSLLKDGLVARMTITTETGLSTAQSR